MVSKEEKDKVFEVEKDSSEFEKNDIGFLRIAGNYTLPPLPLFVPHIRMV